MVNGKQGTWQNVCTVKLDKESFMHCKESPGMLSAEKGQ